MRYTVLWLPSHQAKIDLKEILFPQARLFARLFGYFAAYSRAFSL